MRTVRILPLKEYAFHDKRYSLPSRRVKIQRLTAKSYNVHILGVGCVEDRS